MSPSVPTELYSLSLHDALPISPRAEFDHHLSTVHLWTAVERPQAGFAHLPGRTGDRKSTRLNSSHVAISYAVFCLHKKNYQTRQRNCSLLGLDVGSYSLFLAER